MNSKMMKFYRLVSLALTLIVLVTPVALLRHADAHTVTNMWFTHGPAGRISYSLAINPVTNSTVYTGTDDGVFKSVDSGESWVAASVGLPAELLGDSRTVFALAHDPQATAPGILYAGIDVGDPPNIGTQLFKSTNGGATWIATGLPPVPGGVLALALDPAPVITPSNQRTLYAGTLASGIYKSTDGGATFNAVNNGLTDSNLQSLALYAPSPNILYAGTTMGGVFKTTNGGATWTPASTGLPSSIAGLFPVKSLAIQPNNSDVVYAATSGGGVYKTTNGGTSWSSANNGLLDFSTTAVAIDPVTPATVYAGTNFGGVFKSTDSGANWSAFNNGLTNNNVQSFTIDPATPTSLYAGTSGDGVFRMQQGAAGGTCLTAPLNMISWWPGDGNANDIQDGNNGTLAGGAGFGAGKVAQGFLFNGTDSGVVVPDAPSLNFAAGADFSIDAWIRAETRPAQTFPGLEIQTIVDKRFTPDPSTARGYTLFLVNGQLGFQLADEGNFFNFPFAGSDLRDGQFHHIAVTVDRDNPSGGHLYVDGAVVSTFNPTVRPGNLTNSDPFRIGIHAQTGLNGFFQGVIDEIEIFNRALSSAEMQEIFNAGSAGKCKAMCSTPSFAAASNFGAGSNPESVAVGDFNLDGKPDLAVANGGSGNVSILLGNGMGSFTGPINFGAGTFPRSVAVGDFNLDGKADLATANFNSNNVSILLGNGMGGFSAPTNFGAGTQPNGVTVGDFNLDGEPDLAVANSASSNVSILLGNGMGGFTGPTNFATGSGFTLPTSVAVGDFNLDGKPDLAVANIASGNVSILLGNGMGGFTGPTNFGADSQPASVAVGDFNFDGKPDLAVANSNSFNVSILLGDGMGGFSAPTNFGVGVPGDPRSVAVGDFNLDTKPDLATANFNSNNVSILLGNGMGGFTGPTNFGVGTAPSVAVGDFNLDGKPDLATANKGSDNVSVLLNTCGATPTPLQADLSISKTASPNPVVTGTNVTYTITVTNNGPSTATAVTVTENLPTATTFVACSSTGGGVCSGVGNNRTVTFASLAAGTSATITIVAQVNCSVANGTVISNTATVSSSTTDPNTTNNSATATATASNPPPNITCPNNITVTANLGSKNAVVNYTSPTPTDNCPGTAVVCSSASGSSFPVGATIITCTATDSSGNTASCTFTVTVLSPQQATQSLIDSVNNLVTQGVLNRGEANSSIVKLQAAMQSMDRGNGTAARNQLQAFINQVNALMRSGRLSASQGQALIDAANNVIAHIP